MSRGRAAIVWRARIAVAALAVLAGCGLLAPPEPPARIVDAIPGAEPLPGPVPFGPRSGANGSALVPPFPGYELAWHDEFDGVALDTTRWTAMDRPWKGGVSTPDAIEVKDGVLTIRTWDDASGAHLTGHLGTYPGKFEATYGYFEARIRFHDSPGMWCSFFLYPPTYGQPIGDWGTAGVEIDTVEHRVVDGGGFDNSDLVQFGLNWDGFGADWKMEHQVVGLPGRTRLYGEWRTYSTLWTPEGYVFYVDEVPLWSSSAALSHAATDLYLTCEVGDGGWAGSVPAGGYGSRDASSTWMDADWVRVWQLAP